MDEARKDIRVTEKKARGCDRSEDRREEERDRDGRRKTRSGSVGVRWKRDMGARARSRSRSRRQRSESSSRREAGLCHEVRRMFWESASRDRESVGRKSSQVLRARETQYFQQFKLIDLCVKDIRRRTEEYFACDVVPRCIEESLAVC